MIKKIFLLLTLISIIFWKYSDIFANQINSNNIGFTGTQFAEVISDSQIIDTQTGRIGAGVSEYFINPASNFSANSGLAGTEISNFLARDIKISENFFGEILLLENLKNLIQVSPRDEILKSANQYEKFSEIHDFFLGSLNAGEKSLQQLSVRESILKNKVKQFESEASLLEKKFFNSLDNFSTAISDQNFEIFVRKEKEVVEVKAELGRILALEKYFKIFLPQIEKKLIAMEKNKNALIAGVQVDAVTAKLVDLAK